MEYIEYPKAMYRDGAYVTVADLATQEAAEAEGFTDWHTDQARMSKPAELVAAGAEAEADEKSPRDLLKDQADALGITYARNVTTEKLAELVAAGAQG